MLKPVMIINFIWKTINGIPSTGITSNRWKNYNEAKTGVLSLDV